MLKQRMLPPDPLALYSRVRIRPRIAAARARARSHGADRHRDSLVFGRLHTVRAHRRRTVNLGEAGHLLRIGGVLGGHGGRGMGGHDGGHGDVIYLSA